MQSNHKGFLVLVILCLIFANSIVSENCVVKFYMSSPKKATNCYNVSTSSETNSLTCKGEYSAVNTNPPKIDYTYECFSMKCGDITECTGVMNNALVWKNDKLVNALVIIRV